MQAIDANAFLRYLGSRSGQSGHQTFGKLGAATRIRLAAEIRLQALAWAIGWSDAGEIDVLNILQASLLAMRRALQGLAIEPAHVLIDGNRCPSLSMLGFTCRVEAIVGGDARVAEISAASILAKTRRDAWMVQVAAVYPAYDFERHKGYPTRQHLRLLAQHGPCRLHRQSFAPVRSLHAPS